MSEKRIELCLDDVFSVIDEKIKNGGDVTFSPKGISMLPLLKPGADSVTLTLPRKRPKQGDIVFYRRENGQFVLHRIVGENSCGFILCGDNQFRLEKNITEKHIIAVLKKATHNKKEIDFNSSSYKLYVKMLVFRRMYLRLKYIAVRSINGVLRRIKKLFKK